VRGPRGHGGGCVFFTGMTPTFFGLFRHVFEARRFAELTVDVCKNVGQARRFVEGGSKKRRASPTSRSTKVQVTSGEARRRERVFEKLASGEARRREEVYTK
jgi:hypothetical protein